MTPLVVLLNNSATTHESKRVRRIKRCVIAFAPSWLRIIIAQRNMFFLMLMILQRVYV